MWIKTKYPGVEQRHQAGCGTHSGGKCRCERKFRARYKATDGSWKWSKSVANEDEARSIRSHGRAQHTATAKATKLGKNFNQLADQFFELAESGAISQKGGRPFSRGTLDTYGRMYRNHVRPLMGEKDAARLTVVDWQSWLDGLVRKGLKKNSISVTLNSVRSIYRWACSPNRQILTLNATTGLELPANDETPRDRVATHEEAKKLLAVLEGCDKVAYGVSLYAGLRGVERRPLDWGDVDFPKNTIRLRVTKGEGGAGIRTLPITAPLSIILKAEWLRQGRPASGLVVKGPKGGAPEYDAMVTRAKKAWSAAKLDPIGFHECRHTYISTLIASGVNMKAVSVLAGHASITITADKYGHLFPGHEDEAGRMLDAYYAKPLASAEEDEATKASLAR